MRIMVADDSSTMRTIVKRHLASIGVDDVVEAKDGDDAVEKFKSQAVDLVLTDWNMPGKTGLEVLKEIRKTDGKIPVIMITTEADKSRVMEAVEAGATNYLVKPFTAEMFKDKMAKYID